MPGHSDRRGTPPWAKIGPPRRSCSVQSARSVASLAGATSPCRAPRLTSGLHRAITVMFPYAIWL